MRKLFALTLFVALAVLTGTAAEKTLTWNFTKATKTELTATENTDNGKWVIATTLTSYGYGGSASIGGAQIGSANKPFKTGTVSYNGTIIPETATIKKVAVTTKIGSGGNTTFNVTVGGQALGNSITVSSTTATEYTLEGSLTGNDIVFNVTSSTKAWFISKITVTYDDGLAETTVAPKFSLAAGDVISGSKVTLTTETEGADILYKVGDATDWTAYSAPITLTAAGETTITAKTAAYGDLPESSEVSRTYNVIGIVDVNNLAEFKAKGKADNTAYYRLTCPVTFIAQSISNSSNSIYVVDGDNNGVIIYAKGNSTTYTEGDTFAAGIVGKYTLFGNSQYELLPDTLTAVTAGSLPTPPEMAIADMTQETQGRYVKLSGVTYDGTNFVTGTAKVPVDDLFKKGFKFSEDKTYNVVGLTAYKFTSTYTGGSNFFYPLSAEEVVDETKAVAPTADVEEGTYNDDLTVKLSSATEGATILYKVGDATDWTTYTDAGIILEGGTEAKSYTITAKATADGLGDSDEATFTYTINYYAGTATLVVEDYAAANGWQLSSGSDTTYRYFEATVSPVSFVIGNPGSNDGRYFKDPSWRIYKGANFTVSVPEGYAISKITFTFYDTKYFSSADSGTYSATQWSAADAATSSVTFSAGQTIKLQTVNVEYTIIPSVKVEAHVMSNADGVDEWVDITDAQDGQYATDKTLRQVRITYAPAVVGKTATVKVGDDEITFTVTEENGGVFVYTFDEQDSDLNVTAESDSKFYGNASYTISAPNTSSVAELAADGVKVTATQGGIEITAASAQAAVYDAAGRMAARRAVNGTTAIALSRGLYIVVVDGKAVKVAVR